MNEFAGVFYSDNMAQIGNHLWQTTLFGLLAALTVGSLLRGQRATVRYWLWLVASVKFLLPFSLLVGVGAQIAEAVDFSHRQRPWQDAVLVVSEPFSLRAGHPPVSAMPHLLPLVLFAAWACGLLVVLGRWYVRWRDVMRTVREGVVLDEGPEFTILQQMRRALGVKRSIKLIRCASTLEPAIFGIVRPVMLWPEGISAHLTHSQMQAVIAHEVCHVRRRDNLAAAIHMLVEAIFWFYPLVWWLGARLMRERERACDQQVLELGSEPTAYAQGILTTCKFCIGSALPLVAGVTGAELKQRIVDIMTGTAQRSLSLSTKLTLSSAAVLALAAPTLFGMWRVYQCDGTNYTPRPRPVMCAAVDAAHATPTGSRTPCRVMADELLKALQLPVAVGHTVELGRF